MEIDYIIYDNGVRAFFESLPKGKEGIYITHDIDKAHKFASVDEALDFAEKNMTDAVVLRMA